MFKGLLLLLLYQSLTLNPNILALDSIFHSFFDTADSVTVLPQGYLCDYV